MAKKKNTIPKGENKREKFIRVFAPKVNKALRAIRLLGNGAGAAYERTPDDVSNMLTQLREEIDAVEERFSSKGTTSTSFKFE